MFSPRKDNHVHHIPIIPLTLDRTGRDKAALVMIVEIAIFLLGVRCDGFCENARRKHEGTPMLFDHALELRMAQTKDRLLSHSSVRHCRNCASNVRYLPVPKRGTQGFVLQAFTNDAWKTLSRGIDQCFPHCATERYVGTIELALLLLLLHKDIALHFRKH